MKEGWGEQEGQGRQGEQDAGTRGGGILDWRF